MRSALPPHAVLLALLLVVACRDVTDVFVADDRGRSEIDDAGRLTYSPYDDRAPTWNATSDTVYYAGRSPDHAAFAASTILALPRSGGTARPVLENVQAGSKASRWLLAPATAPDGERIAIVEMQPLRPTLPCNAPEILLCDIDVVTLTSIRLGGATLRARSIDALGALDDDPGLSLAFGDVTMDTAVIVPGFPTWVTRYHPYQRAYLEEVDYPFRASWSPDGSRLATSDGRGVLVWDPATGTATRLPGTEDAANPAWSPDGEWIAHTWSERIDSISSTCALGESPSPDTLIVQCYERRILYVTAPPRIVLTRVDGSERRVIAEGRDPAWDPAGRLYFSGPSTLSTDRLRRVDIQSGESIEIPFTEGAREAAISPDGRWVAFSRFGFRTDPRDIYVAALP